MNCWPFFGQTSSIRALVSSIRATAAAKYTHASAMREIRKKLKANGNECSDEEADRGDVDAALRALGVEEEEPHASHVEAFGPAVDGAAYDP